MRIVRVHNPSRIAIAKRKAKKGSKMAARRKRKTRHVRRRRAVARINPRRRRRHTRRRRNPMFVARTTRRHHRRRHHRRRRSNPSFARAGAVLKEALYGAGGAVLTRAGSQILGSFVPQLTGFSAYAEPIVQAATAHFIVGPLVGKFLGSSQGQAAKVGGYISAGLSLFDKVLPNLQGQLVGLAQRPIQAAPGAAVQQVQGGGMGDVYAVDLQEAGFGDVYDTTMDQFNGLPMGLY